ncbi:hypothetical protein TFLX_04399 [Thermoflexales bacterium]|nr:hypothetical protein TFLX_04399 [Thermoflexales bacterium]
MIRLIILVGLLFICHRLVSRLADILKFQIEWTSFWAGLGVAMVVGFVYFLITDWWSTVTRPTRPQSVTQTTTETPRQITMASFWAIIRGIVIFIVVAIIVFRVLVSQ